MKILRIIGLVLVVLFVGMQFFPVEKNTGSGSSPTALANRFPIPDEIEGILRVSCNDCHTGNTRYPWYVSIQPVGWWIADHIEEGKEHFDLDLFLTYSPWLQYHKFQEIREMIELEEMPLPSYLLIHRDAVLSSDQAGELTAWSDAMRDSMSQWYPPDSLQRPRR